jgi:hypothetical protein
VLDVPCGDGWIGNLLQAFCRLGLVRNRRVRSWLGSARGRAAHSCKITCNLILTLVGWKVVEEWVEIVAVGDFDRRNNLFVQSNYVEELKSLI